ncbi:MAG: hypothetical protein A2252_11005 [Elusimicrobia bacterium RIFOXYA2_FULL_39_19]|nr:MAG: hypothetical protein A2252_11005 [Elusimicrobia bacterium RIFOXYA2_FULL_39_19]
MPALYASDTAFLVLRVGGAIIDTTPPTPVTDLNSTPEFVTGLNDEGGGKIRLEWTAPVDMPDERPVYSYIIRYATFSIYDVSSDTTAWWNHASVKTITSPIKDPIWGIPATGLPHSYQSYTLTGLNPSQLYWFGIQSLDNVFNHSALDDKARYITYQSSTYASTSSQPPAPLSDLLAQPTDGVPGSIKLTWTAMGNDYTSNRIIDGKYRIVYSTVVPPLIDAEQLKQDPLAYWNYAQQIIISTSNVYPGENQTVYINNLNTGVTYYFLSWTSDEWFGRNNWSYQSNTGASRAFNYYPPDEINNLLIDTYASTDISSATYVALTWRNPQVSDVRGFDGVKILYSTETYPSDLSHSQSITLSGLTPHYWTTYLHLKLEPRTTYYYKMYTFDTSDPVLYSGTGTVASVYTAYDVTAPDAVTNLTALAEANDAIGSYVNLNWTHPDFDKTQYQNRGWVKTVVTVSTDNYLANGGYPYQSPVELLTSATCYQINQLQPQNTYYFEIMTVDEVNNFSIATTSIYVWKDVLPPAGISSTSVTSTWSEDINEGCIINLSWNYPDSSDLDKMYVTYRTDRLPENAFDGAYFFKTPMKLTADSLTIKELVGNTSYYFGFFLSDWSNNFSSMTKVGFVNIPKDDTVPLPPLNITNTRDGNAFTVSWLPVQYQQYTTSQTTLVTLNQTSFRSSEIYRYQVLTSADMANWTLAVSTKPNVPQPYVSLTVTDEVKYYKIRAVDICGNYNDSMVVDDSQDLNLYSVISDNSYVKMGKDVKDTVKDTFIKWTRDAVSEKGPIFRSFVIEPYKIVDGQLKLSAGFSFEKPKAQVSIKYDNQTIASRGAQMNKVLQEPEKWLSLFYFNGKEWSKLSSAVDAVNQGVKSDVKYLGMYQIRYALKATEFTYYEVKPKIITPNNDGQNDRALFRFDNPKTTEIRIKIFDMNGQLVKEIDRTSDNSNTPGGYMYWDGTDTIGSVVIPGTYIYQLEGEGKVFNGTIVVAR